MFEASLRQKTGWVIAATAALLLLGALSSSVIAGERSTTASKANARQNTARTTIEATTIKVSPRRIATLAGNTVPGGTIAGVVLPPGDIVYNNQSESTVSIYLPNSAFVGDCTVRPTQFMADDFTLASGPTTLSGFALLVAGVTECGAATFDVRVELWNGNPCNTACATLIAGTETDFTAIVNDGTVQLLSKTFAVPVDVPGTVWMRAEFSTNDSGWMLGFDTDGPGSATISPNAPDLGTTLDFWAEDDATDGCDLYDFASGNHAGFWATLWQTPGAAPTGACCNGTTCSVVSEADCVTAAGTWQGTFTDCDLNYCQPGACCTGADFQTCTDGSEATCADGIFHPDLTCADTPCGPNFIDYENSFFTQQFFASRPDNWVEGDPPSDIIAADDITFGSGRPCEVSGYEMIVFGQCNAIDGLEFDARLALWSNDDGGTPADPSDDRPLAEIPGTSKTFTGIPADQTGHALVVVPTATTIVGDRVWVAIETTPDIGGPGLAGLAVVGDSLDQFAEFNFPSNPNDWTIGRFFGGFTPELCPGVGCTPAGSFRIRAWCAGDPPTGACCDSFAGTCTDNVAERDCNGRWADGETCANPTAFDPPCGTHACCFNFLTPDNIICADRTEEACAATNGALARGVNCTDIDFPGCPASSCINKQGDCFAAHPTGGCDDAFCCDTVCTTNPTTNGFCCELEWDANCATQAATLCARDDCEQAVTISGEGLFSFDTTNATQDGPSHDACNSQGGGTDIDKDTWFVWTSTCEGTAFVRTCTHTAVDTMIAVYAGTVCPTSDASLLDCDDEKCTPQSLATFDASAGQQYLIRVGSRVAAPGGQGQIEITCGPPNNDQCLTPDILAGDCCSPNPTAAPTIPACSNEVCCASVCACDAFCCNTEWDDACAGLGFNGLGCGAEVLCEADCGPKCLTGSVVFVSPEDNTIDARMPHQPNDTGATLGITTIVATAPAGVPAECWTLCETGTPAVANTIFSITEVAGEYTIELALPLAEGEATTLTYTDDALAETIGTFISHPANTNGDGNAGASDVLALVGELAGGTPLPFGAISSDTDHSGTTTASDILTVIDLLNGAEQFTPWNSTTKPSSRCP
jgi:hypothetical protein